MEPVDLGQVCAWTQGDLKNSKDMIVPAVSTDTRSLERGACFVALVGERFDGHDFLAEAVRKGAAAAIVEGGRPALQAELPLAFPLVLVDDTTKALQRFARGYRRRFDVPVIGVTGSNGKTTTKDMIASILRYSGPVAATKGNLNNHIGLPLTLLDVESVHRAVVVEMGMSALGEIAALAKIAEPTVGVVTNVGPVHLEQLGSIEGVAQAKAELVQALPSRGYAVLNADDPRVRAMADETQAQVITFGLEREADVRGSDLEVKGVGGCSFELTWRGPVSLCPHGSVSVTLPIPGRHHVMNALAAAGAAIAAGAGMEAVCRGLASVRHTEMRMQVVPLGQRVTVVNDAYNASPLSTRAALETVAGMQGRRKVAVLGDMLELGAAAESSHREIGQLVFELGFDRLVCVGPLSRWIVESAKGAGLKPDRVLWYGDAVKAATQADHWSRAGDVILVKGSRGVRLERVTQALKERFGPASQGESEDHP